MRTILLHRTGGPEVLELTSGPTPVPGPGQVLVRAHTIGVSRPDILIRKGLYTWAPPLPANPGNEMAGTIEKIGPGVTELKGGDRVLLTARELPVRGGCYADYICVNADVLFRLPEHVDFEHAVALPNYLVAHAMLELGATNRTRSIFVTGLAGGIAAALVELAKAKDLTVIGTVSSDEKAAYARSIGADHVINYRSENVAERVLAVTKGCGVDLAFDHIVGPAFADFFNLVGDLGTLVVYNIFNEMPVKDMFAEMREQSSKSLALRVFSMHTYDHHRDERRRLTEQLIGLLTAGKIKPRIAARLPLEKAGDAQALLEAGTVIGKVVLIP